MKPNRGVKVEAKVVRNKSKRKMCVSRCIRIIETKSSLCGAGRGGGRRGESNKEQLSWGTDWGNRLPGRVRSITPRFWLARKDGSRGKEKGLNRDLGWVPSGKGPKRIGVKGKEGLGYQKKNGN